MRLELRAEAAEVERAFGKIEDEELLAAYEDEWLSRGLEPPPATAAGLRAQARARLKARAERPPGELLLTITQAAPHLGKTERQLRHEVDQGAYDDQLATQRDGRRALRFEAPRRRWAIMFPVPDPRVLAMMVKAGVGPGGSYSFRIKGSGAEQVYTRRADGANWREPW